MITESTPLFKRFYHRPDHNKTAVFFSAIRSELGPYSHVLNLGAGPGNGNPLCCVRGEVGRVIGADIDPAVLQNPELDEAHVVTNGRLPFDDACFDLAFSDCVVEHVEDPAQFLAEVHRVLKPGAAFHLRTPNIWHYVTLISRLTPHWFHELVANRVRGLDREEQAPYPTFYRLNTCKSIRRAAAEAGFTRVDLKVVEGHPSYLVFSLPTFLAGVAYERLVNSSELFSVLRSSIIARLEK